VAIIIKKNKIARDFQLFFKRMKNNSPDHRKQNHQKTKKQQKIKKNKKIRIQKK